MNSHRPKAQRRRVAGAKGNAEKCSLRRVSKVTTIPPWTALSLIGFFLAALYAPKDYDLGWHLAYGEYFVQHHRLLDKNLLSSTMVNYPWISSSWLLDPLTYFLFTRWGFASLSVLGALVATSILYSTINALNLCFFEQIFTLIFLYFYLDYINDASFRGQTVSLAFLALAMLILQRYERGDKHMLFSFIPLFFIWANLHTQYALGLGLTGIWLVGDSLRRHLQGRSPNSVRIICILLGSLLATFINPRGPAVLLEISRHFNDPSQTIITEWLPFEPHTFLWAQFVLLDIALAALFLRLIIQRKVVAYLPWMGITLVLMLAGWWMRRYAGSLAIVATFVLIPFIRELKVGKGPATKIALIVAFIAFSGWIVIRKLPREGVWSMSWQRYCRENVGCSDESAQFILDHGLEKEKLWTYYGFGGWLIWNYPEIKPSIDGRMASWRDERGYSAWEENYKQEAGVTSIDASEYDVVYTLTSKPIYAELQKLVKEKKWKRAYQDLHAAIFVRNKETL